MLGFKRKNRSRTIKVVEMHMLRCEYILKEKINEERSKCPRILMTKREKTITLVWSCAKKSKMNYLKKW